MSDTENVMGHHEVESMTGKTTTGRFLYDNNLITDGTVFPHKEIHK